MGIKMLQKTCIMAHYLLNDSVLNSLVIDGVKGNATLQLVEGHISK